MSEVKCISCGDEPVTVEIPCPDCEVLDEGYPTTLSLIGAVSDLYEALKIAEIKILADLNMRIQQPIEREANETILEVIEKALKKAEGKK